MLASVVSLLALHLPSRAPASRMSASSAATIDFAKYQGLGNDFVLVDCREQGAPALSPEQAAGMCDRNFGVGADGVIFVLPPDMPDAKYKMRIYNSDGSEPEMCGNGIRCMARFVGELEATTESTFGISTLAGLIKPELRADGTVCVDMGEPFLKATDVPTTLPVDDEGRAIDAPLTVAGQEWQVTCVGMGNPHAIVFVDDVDALDLAGVGPLFECDAVFPAKTNTEFVQVLSPTHLKMKVWERGAGPTLACGTGACALTVAAILTGRSEKSVPVTVSLPGGDLVIEWREADNRLYMTGPAEKVFAGAYRYD